jgi:ribonuclease-3
MQIKNKNLYKSKKLYADTFEASIGEYFLLTKQNYGQVRKFIFSAFKSLYIELDLIFDPISQLNEAGQRIFNNLPIYTLVKKSGPDHDPEFKVRVTIVVGKKTYKRTADGKSKQIAKEKAAKNLYQFLKGKGLIKD